MIKILLESRNKKIFTQSISWSWSCNFTVTLLFSSPFFSSLSFLFSFFLQPDIRVAVYLFARYQERSRMRSMRVSNFLPKIERPRNNVGAPGKTYDDASEWVSEYDWCGLSVSPDINISSLASRSRILTPPTTTTTTLSVLHIRLHLAHSAARQK